MPTYVLLSHVTPGAATDPGKLTLLGARVSKQVQAECPTVYWRASYEVNGPFDYLDVFDAPDLDAAHAVERIAQSAGSAETTLMTAAPWDRLADLDLALGNADLAVEGLEPVVDGSLVTEASEESFPASDPPAYTGGRKRDPDLEEAT